MRPKPASQLLIAVASGLLLAAALLHPPAGAASPSPLIQTMVDAVSEAEITNTIRHLQDDDSLPGWDALQTRYSYSPHLAVERDYIKNRMEALGLDVRYHSFTESSLSLYNLQNVEGTLAGWGPGEEVVYLVTAHYDSVVGGSWLTPTLPAPGADDNASGVAGVLEAARVLSRYRFRHTLRFVTFAAEEQGLIGSKHYAAEARAANTPIGGVINHDMIAWDGNGDGAIDLHVGTRPDSQALGLAYLSAISTYHIPLTAEYITEGATTRSDHYRFWRNGYPALLAIEDFSDFNPHYHTPTDTLAMLDTSLARRFVQATVATLAEAAGIISPGVTVSLTGPASVSPGEGVQLRVMYGNATDAPATGVAVTATLGGGLRYQGDSGGGTLARPASRRLVWQAGTLAPYSHRTVVITASVAESVPLSSRVTATVRIGGAVPTDDPADNRADWSASTPPLPRTFYLPLILQTAP